MSSAGKERRKILIIEDENTQRILLRHNLEMEGFDVVEAGTGKTALQKAWNDRPDAAILDIGLPDMTGWEVCDALKGDPRSKNLPIMVLTSNTGDDVEERMSGLELKYFILKPYNPEDVVDMIKKILSGAGK